MLDKTQPIKIVVINMVVTFFQAALPVWALAGNKIDNEVLIAVGAAGGSAVWNLVLKPLIKEYTDLYKKG